jgi:subfamily B ATP-binding cassette protein MsbA
MPQPQRDQSYRNIARFYRFTLPYWKLVVLGMVAIAINGVMMGSAVVLIGPATQAIVQRESDGQAGTLAALPGAPKATSATQKKVEQWLANQPVFQKLKQWFYPGASLPRVAFVLAVYVAPLLLISGFVSQYLQGAVVSHILADLREALFRKVSGFSLSYFAHHRTGELVSRLTNDLNQTAMALRVIFGKIVQDPFKILVLLGVALWASWQLTLIGMVVTPLMVYTTGWFGRRIRRSGTRSLSKLADVTDSMTQMLTGIRVVKSFNMEGAENEQFRERNQAQLRRVIGLVRNRALGDTMPDVIMLIPIVLVAVVGDHLLAARQVDLGSMAKCFVAMGLMYGPVRRTVNSYNDLQQSLAGVNRMFELLDTETGVQDSPGAVELTGVKEGVAFSNVWFSYGGDPVLRGINLSVPRGNVYAIVGETGAGKSTMLDLVPRFYDVTDGAITIDGVDVRQLTRASLMKQIAIVGQHPFLFNRTIAENIRYGKPTATDEEMMAAARAANIHDFIMSLPEGYETLAGETGGRFSGGQRQCLTIARAILKNAPILILDEATSSLDAESEMLVQQALNNLMENRTTFVIAHRLSTVRHANRIVVLKDGRLVEEGSHQELLELGGEYSRLYRLQFAEAPK